MGEPSAGQPMHAQAQKMGLDGKPLIRRLAVDAAAHTQHFIGETPLIVEAAHVLDGRVRKCQIKGGAREACVSAVSSDISKSRRQVLGRLINIQERDAFSKAGAIPHLHRSAKIDHGPAIAEF